MSNDLIPLGDETAGLPAHLANAFSNENDDLTSGVSGGYPIISYKGKVWAVTDGGTKRTVLRDDGDAAASLQVVIVKANPIVTKVYYEGAFVEGSDSKPTCYSDNGVTPASDAQVPQCDTCALCPHNQWGSSQGENGGKGKACSDNRRLAVAPSNDLDNVMLLRVPPSSLRALRTYAQALGRRKAPYQAVITKIGFDPNVAYPSFTFTPVGWVSPEDLTRVQELMESDTVGQIIGSDPLGLPPRPAHVQGSSDTLSDPAPKPAPKPAAKPKAAENKPAAKPKPKAEAKAPAPNPEEVKEPVGKEVGDDLEAELAAALDGAFDDDD